MSKYTLIITEKPDAAMRITLAIDENQDPKRVSENGVPYYVAKRQKEILNIMASYKEWKKALNISWKEYLSEIAKNPLAGEWPKEVAQHLMRN
jgi:hypothetical protein